MPLKDLMFIDGGEALSRPLVARVASGIGTKEELFEVLGKVLKLPDYFGGNWDALDECLRDLSWIEDRQVAIVHEDIPMRNDQHNARIYLEILASAVADWEREEPRKLIVVFPRTEESAVSRLLLDETVP